MQTTNEPEALAFVSWVKGFYVRNKHSDFRIRSNLESLVNYFISACSLFDSVSIIIDGVDECLPRERLLKMVSKFVDYNIRVLIASRPEADIQEAFGAYPKLEMDPGAVDADIKTHIKSRFASDPKLRHLLPGLQLEITEELLDKHDGMYSSGRLKSLTCRFRWGECQLDTISRYRSDDARKAAIKTLPRGLDATYVRMLETIEDQSEDDLNLVCQAITWVIFACRPLWLDELAIAVAVNPDREFTDSQKVDENDIQELCSSFIRVNSRNVVEIAHYSVTQFFTTPKFEKTAVNRYFMNNWMSHSNLLGQSFSMAIE
jgi:hypothetical protein